MNTTKNILLLFALFIGVQLSAQERGNRGGQGPRGGGSIKKKVKGMVLDASTQQALEYATITIYSKRDSSVVTGGITDGEGKFSIDTRPGRFFGKIEFLGYQAFNIPMIDLGKEKMEADLGTISLNPDAEMLAEVEVRAEKSEMQFLLDKKVFNVGKDLSTTSSSAADLLDNVPSVAVDIDGGVTLRGSGNVRILIDGKPSGLIGVGDANGLRQIPANMIDKVEVITNPSARYEAAGTTGIINIVLRKEKKKGLNGSIDLSTGLPKQIGAAINFNLRKEKFNLFLNYGLSWRNNPGGGFTDQNFYRGDSTFITEQTRSIDRSGLSHNIRFGSDFFLGKKSTLTTSFSYRISDENNLSEVHYLDFINTKENLLLETTRTDDEREDETDITLALNFEKTYDRKGQKLTADFQYETSGEVESSDFLERYLNANGAPTGSPNLQQKGLIDESNSEFLLKADYVHPFGENGKFETGYRGSLRQIRNDFEVQEFADNLWGVLPNLSNDFIYNENIQGVYALYGNKMQKFSYQIGLRGEYTDIKTELVKTNEKNPRSYFNLFPNATFTYDLPAQNAIQLSYSRRITRPRYWYLNPFLSFSDARNPFVGNPDLDPELTHSVELAHLKYFEKGSISTGIYYRHTDDVIQRVRVVTDETNALTLPQNLGIEDAFGIEFTYNYNIEKWWSVNGEFIFFRSIIDGMAENQNLDRDAYSYKTRLTSKMTIWKKLDTQFRFNYRGPIESVQGRSLAVYNLDFGLSLDVLKNKGTLTLSARDLLNTRKRRAFTSGENFDTYSEFQWRSRQINLNFNYRINQKKKRGGQRGAYDGGGEGF